MENYPLRRIIDQILQLKQFYIGLHCIVQGRVKENLNLSPEEIGDKVLNESLTIRDGRYLNGTVRSLGLTGVDDTNISHEIMNYVIGDNQTNVIVAHPIIIRNSENDCLFLGYSDSNCSGYSISSFLDYAFNKKHKIPSEFIFGFYEEKNSDGNYEFKKNEKFIAGEKVSDEFFNSINENLGYFSEISKKFAKFVHGEISEAKMDEFLNQIFTLFQDYSMTEKIELVKKMKKQADMYRSKLNMLEQDRAE